LVQSVVPSTLTGVGGGGRGVADLPGPGEGEEARFRDDRRCLIHVVRHVRDSWAGFWKQLVTLGWVVVWDWFFLVLSRMMAGV
jgi:hypothetical protein